MPELLWLYLTALLYDRTSASCVALAEALQSEEEPPLQEECGLGLSATRLLGSHRPAHRRLKSLGRQTRRQVVRHQPPHTASG